MRRPSLTASASSYRGRIAARIAGVIAGAALLGGAVVPAATAPGGIAPGGTAPVESAPAELAPAGTVPAATVPAETAPAETASASVAAAEAAARAARVRATDDRTIAHVLNRIGFGPMPGDVARLREMGLDRYIQQQLQPERLPDTALQARLTRFETLQLESREIADRFYQLQELQRTLRQARAKSDTSDLTPPSQAPAATALPNGQHGSAQPGSAQPGPAQPGPVQPGSTQSGPVQPGSMQPGGAAQPPAPARTERDELLAQASPEDRQRLMDLRKQNQRVLNELSEQKLVRAVYSDRQLEEVLVDFWFNHFNVFAGKGLTRIYLTEYERDAIRPHVLGKFRDLLGATAHSPAMLFYLDNWQSSDPDAAANVPRRRMPGDPTMGVPRPRRRMPRDGAMRQGGTMPRDGAMPRPAAPNGASNPQRPRATAPGVTAGMSDAERQPRPRVPARPRRGLNENYARELMELHTLGVDGGGYTQRDIVQVAKCFTGWTIQEPRRGGGFLFDDRRHTRGPKTVLGHEIDKGGVGDGEAVLDLLASHESTATFIATKLARRFVSDEPPKALVQRAAATFRSTDGHLREVLRTILTSPEFLSAEAMRAKVKTPFEFVASALRATGAQIEDGTILMRNLQGLGMPLYMAQPPTGYVDRADVWVNTGALLNRMNFAVALVNNRLRGVRLDLGAIAGIPSAPAPNGAAAPRDLTAARAALLASLLSNEVSDATRATIAKGSQITQVAALTLGSPEFQRR